MSDDSIKVPPGSDVQIALRRKRTKPQQSRVGSFPISERGIVPVDDETPRYLRRQKPETGIRFFDLGTRLRSVSPVTVVDGVATAINFDGLRRREADATDLPTPHATYYNEYVEIPLEVPVTPVFSPDDNQWHMTVSGEQNAILNRQLLGALAETADDPLSPVEFSDANGSGRRLPHAMELFEGNDGYPQYPFHILVFLTGTGIVREFKTLPGDTTPQLYYKFDGTLQTDYNVWGLVAEGVWSLREPEENEDEENWNPDNEASGAAHNQYAKPQSYKVREGDLLLSAGTLGLAPGVQIVDAPFSSQAGIYYGFDTGDTDNYKLTAEPSFEAETVAFSFRGKDNFVYLRPLPASFMIATEVDDDPALLEISRAWVGRVPVYPAINNIGCAVRRSEYGGIPGAGEVITGAALDALPVGALLGIIMQGQKIFYVWRKALHPNLPLQSEGATYFQESSECPPLT